MNILHDKKTSLDKAKLSLVRSEYQVMRFMQQIQDLFAGN